MKKLFAVAASVAFLLVFGGVLIQQAQSQSAYPQAPDFTVTDINGKTVSLSDYRGKVLFLNFWATWCPPCRAEIPDFVDVYTQEKAKGLEIVGISLDTKGKDVVAGFVQKYKVNYPIVLETRKATEQLLSDFEPGEYIPTTIVIDKMGRIRGKKVGQMEKAELLKYFNQLKAE
jgi:peroxiredoxin